MADGLWAVAGHEDQAVLVRQQALEVGSAFALGPGEVDERVVSPGVLREQRPFERHQEVDIVGRCGPDRE
ncbi:MAG: hypothetical protein IPL07_20060 [Acidimicrobiaceae bacterium]|nr:hypothetical protein [Acidimicrobiaceae bacterium]